MSNPLDNRTDKRRDAGIVISSVLAALMLAGCASTPDNYAATLSKRDPKWQTAQCRQAREDAANYKERKVSWGAGMLLGPYGLALAAAGKEHQEKQRLLLAREMHMNCSSQPLPAKLRNDPRTQMKTPTR